MYERKIYSIILIFACQLLAISLYAQNLERADSLFNAKKYSDAAKIYEAEFEKSGTDKMAISLKLAYISEVYGDFAKLQYYLNYRYNLGPSDIIYNKIDEVAIDNKLLGYEKSDANFLILFFKQYYVYVLYFLIAIGLIVLSIFYNKFRKRESIRLRHKFLYGFYLIGLVFLINISYFIDSGVVKEEAFYRDFPTSGAELKGSILPGNKVNIMGESNDWLRIFWNKHFVYIKKSHVWQLP
ncbi:MAG: hypothetical protein ACRCVT_06920 [Leadbetterella sp.]